MGVGAKVAGMLAAAGVLAIAGSASAAAMVLTIDGTVNGLGYDSLGLFGPQFGMLSGDISVQLFYDPDLGRRTLAPGYEDINGGPGYFPFTYASPVTAVTITANGQQTSFATAYSGSISTFGGSFLSFNGTGDLPPGGFSRPYALGNMFGVAAPLSLEQAYSAAVACTACANFQIALPVPGQTYSYASFAQIDVTRISIASAAPAPEPAAWTLMITGFGVAGVALRRRRSVAMAA